VKDKAEDEAKSDISECQTGTERPLSKDQNEASLCARVSVECGQSECNEFAYINCCIDGYSGGRTQLSPDKLKGTQVAVGGQHFIRQSQLSPAARVNHWSTPSTN